MSRASEITLFLIILQASIGLINGMGVFDQTYIGTPQNEADYNVSHMEFISDAQTDGQTCSGVNCMLSQAADSASIYLYWTWETLFFVIKIIFTVVIVFPTLVSVFNIPPGLAALLQVGIYYVYAMFYIQYKSGKGMKLYE